MSMKPGPLAPASVSDEVQRGLAGLSPGRFVWARSGHYVYFEARAGDTDNIWRIGVDPQTERWIKGPERLTTGAGQDTDVALSRDGTRLLFTTRSTRTRLWAFPFNAASGQITGEPRPITAGSTGEVDFDACTDGSKLAYRAIRAGRFELWERSLAEGRERLLLSSADWRFSKPRWSPDGTKLAYSRRGTSANSAAAVAILNTDGSGEQLVTKPDDVELLAWDWSKDGSTILGACRFSRSERYGACLVPVSGPSQAGGPFIRTVASDPIRNLFNQRFSPDERWLSFLAHDPKDLSTSTVYVSPATGGRWTAITEGTWFDDKPRWGPDGRVLYFVSNRTGVFNVWGRRFDPSTGTPVGEAFQVTSFGSAQFMLTSRTAQMDIGVTATHLLLPVSESRGEVWMLDQVNR
jgi:Tol biopolymer transport system component